MKGTLIIDGYSPFETEYCFHIEQTPMYQLGHPKPIHHIRQRSLIGVLENPEIFINGTVLEANLVTEKGTYRITGIAFTYENGKQTWSTWPIHGEQVIEDQPTLTSEQFFELLQKECSLPLLERFKVTIDKHSISLFVRGASDDSGSFAYRVLTQKPQDIARCASDIEKMYAEHIAHNPTSPRYGLEEDVYLNKIQQKLGRI